jgi:hypothetical protein
VRINMEESLGQRCDLVKGASAETDIDSTNLERLEKEPELYIPQVYVAAEHSW